MRVDQWVPHFAPHDAIGDHVVAIQKVLRAAGIESDTWAEVIHAGRQHDARPFGEYQSSGAKSAILYHASTNSSMAAALAGREESLLIDYHNITPPKYFARWDSSTTALLVQARAELAGLAKQTELGLADSAYNESELIELGYAKTAVVPILIDVQQYQLPPDARTMARLSRQRDAGGARWLFVGRLAPNKCQHDVIAAFAAYRRLVDPRAKLTLVGGVTSRLYLRAVQRLIGELDLGDSVELAHGLAFADLLAYYRCADVFVCLSEHEGFCVPLVEAMSLGVPVVALAAAAVTDTVGPAGILLGEKDPVLVAAAVDRVLHDAGLRSSLTEAGRRRAAELDVSVSAKHLLDVVTEHLAGAESAGALAAATVGSAHHPGSAPQHGAAS